MTHLVRSLARLLGDVDVGYRIGNENGNGTGYSDALTGQGCGP